MKKKGFLRKAILILGTIYCVLYIVPTFVPPGAPTEEHPDGEERLPSWYTNTFDKRLGFGLDLQGGLELRYSVDYRSAIGGNLLKAKEGIEDDIVKALVEQDNAKTAEAKLDPDNLSDAQRKKYMSRFSMAKTDFNQLQIIFSNADDSKALTADLVNLVDASLVISGEGSKFSISIPAREVHRIRNNIVEQTIEIIRRRIEAFGLVEPDVRAAGRTDIDVQLPGVGKNKMDFVRERIGQTAQLTFRIVDDEVDYFAEQQAKLDAYKTANPGKTVTVEFLGGDGGSYFRAVNKSELVTFSRTLEVPDDHLVAFEAYEVGSEDGSSTKYWRTMYIFRRIEVAGDRVSKSFVGITGQGEKEPPGTPYVSIVFDRRGAREFEDTTRNYEKKRMAILLDDEVSSAPQILTVISGGHAKITLGQGNRQQILQDANSLVTVLTHGAYKAPVHKVHDHSVGPSLGADTVNAGVTSMVVGSILVFLFVLLYYGKVGLIANMGLILNLVYILSILIAMNTALTLPGIAGILLTVGMAVDANVIINERIREELRAGRSVRAAVQTGYARAFWTVFDANITTALAAFILLNYTTGPLHNFAVTLLVGIVCTMFTAVYVTRKIFDFLLDRGLDEIKF
jgi:preprotein translocase subunit SecD